MHDQENDFMARIAVFDSGLGSFSVIMAIKKVCKAEIIYFADQKNFPYGKKTKKQLRREFRKNPTKSEKIMWEALRNRKFLNFKFRRQHLVEKYILDFYCIKLKVHPINEYLDS